MDNAQNLQYIVPILISVSGLLLIITVCLFSWRNDGWREASRLTKKFYEQIDKVQELTTERNHFAREVKGLEEKFIKLSMAREWVDNLTGIHEEQISEALARAKDVSERNWLKIHKEELKKDRKKKQKKC